MIVITSDQLTYIKDIKTLVADISDLAYLLVGHLPKEIAIKSVRTGVSKVFRFKNTHRDTEGDITHWAWYDYDTSITLILHND